MTEIDRLRAALTRIATSPTRHADAPMWYCECAVCIAIYALRETDPPGSAHPGAPTP